MILDEAVVDALIPIFGKGKVYSNVSPDILERDLDRNFKPFAIFKANGGEYHPSFERIYDTEKDNYHVRIEVWGTRIADVRRLAIKARNAILESKNFIAVYREGGMVDGVELGNKLFGCSQDFSLWLFTET